MIVTCQGLKFSELSDKAKNKAREWYKYGFGADDDSIVTDIRERFREMLIENGFDDMKFFWSLSYCQGDGVAFEGPVDLNHYLAVRDKRDEEMTKLDMADPRFDPHKLPIEDKADLVTRCPDLISVLDNEEYACLFICFGETDFVNIRDVRVKIAGRYYNESSMTVNVDIQSAETNDQEVTNAANRLEEEISQHVKSLSIDMKREGYNIIEGYTEDKYVDDQCETGYFFDEYGAMISRRDNG